MAEISTPKLVSPSYFLINILNQLDGRSPSSWLAKITGLSQSRFRNGASQSFHRSTIEKINQHQINLIKENLPDADIQKFPSRATGMSCPFQDFAFKHQFPLLQMLSKEIDTFDQSLIQISENPTASSLKNITSGTYLLDDPIYWLNDNSNDLRDTIDECTSEEGLVSIANRISINIFLSFLVTYDLEFCSTAFGKNFKLRPLFLELIPKAHFEISDNRSNLALPRHKRFSLPSRRLLELTHAIFYYVKFQEWPEKPANRRSLQDFSDDMIGNYFDGTKRLNSKNYERFTRELRKYFENSSEAVLYPLLVATLFWENLLVAKDNKAKLQSVTLYDGKYYKELWEFHHTKWASQLQSSNKDWPTWLNN